MGVQTYQSGGGVDDILALLTEGEYVIRKSVVDAVGVENLDRLNKTGQLEEVDIEKVIDEIFSQVSSALNDINPEERSIPLSFDVETEFSKIDIDLEDIDIQKQIEEELSRDLEIINTVKVSPNIDAEIPNVMLESPNINFAKPNINFEAPEIDIPNIEVPNLSLKSPDINFEKPDVNLDMPNIESPEIAVPEIAVPDVDISDISIPEIAVPEIDVPDIDVPSVEIPNIYVDAPIVDIPEISADDFDIPNLQIEDHIIDIDSPVIDLDIPELDFNGASLEVVSPTIDIESPNIGFDVPNIEIPSIELEDIDLKINNPKVEFDVPTIELETPDINIDFPSIQDITLPVDVKIDPIVDIKAKSIEVSNVIDLLKLEKEAVNDVNLARRNEINFIESYKKSQERILSNRSSSVVDFESSNRIEIASDSPTNNINISFKGNVVSDSFIEDEAIPKIKEAIRRGADIGIG